MTVGSRIWVVAGGRVPVKSTGPEPEFVSQDRLSLLNCGEREISVELTVYYEHREPGGPYRISVKPRRLRRIRTGDLIEPEAIPLGIPYAILISADEPVVVQFGRLDSGSRTAALLLTTAFPED